MKNLLALLALLTAVAFTACDDCGATDGGTEETTDTCSDGGVTTTGGTTPTADMDVEVDMDVQVNPVNCVMPAHNGEMSFEVDGLCAGADADCGDGIAYNGDSACSTSGLTVCCITADAIQEVIDDTFRPNGDPSLCGQQGGFCVDQTADGACDIDGRSLEASLCPGSDDILCCK